MAVLPIYLYGTKILKTRAKPAKEMSNHLIKLVYDMFDTMHEANGMGLAATQVGDHHRVLVVDITEVDEEERKESNEQLRVTSPGLPRKVVMINPEILEKEGSWKMNEGCLSIPDVHGAVERAEKIRVRFRDANFKQQELLADGLLARVMLHEIDHLDGILFTELLSAEEKALVKPDLKKIKEGDVETSYPIITAEEE
ncbi:MAG TPA: peptide deformylase [Bacteroidota bacterium]